MNLLTKSCSLCFSPTLTFTLDLGLGFAGDSAWSPEVSSFYQHITMDLGGRFEIRSISTRGRAHTNEYVTEYIVQYSDDGQAWISYESQDGVDEVLKNINDIYHVNSQCFVNQHFLTGPL